MEFDEISYVNRGANQKANVVMWKSDTDANAINKAWAIPTGSYDQEHGVADWVPHDAVPGITEAAQLTELVKADREEHYAATPWEWDEDFFDDDDGPEEP